jgi:hypothetical protein
MSRHHGIHNPSIFGTGVGEVLSPAKPENKIGPAVVREDEIRIHDPATGKDAMHLRFVTKTIHSYLDYPVALSLMAMPFVLGLGSKNPLALWISVAAGVAALILTILTDHATGLIRVIPYWLHVVVDRLVGVVFIVVPFAFGFQGLDAWYYWANAAAVLLVTTVLNAPEPKDEVSGLMRA